MTGAIRAGLIWGLLGALVFALCLLFAVDSGGSSLVLGLAAVLAGGCGAGYSAARAVRARPGRGVVPGATAGACGGSIVLLASLLAVTVLTSLLQQRVDFWLQAAARFVTVDIELAPYLQGGGRFLGVCLGLVSFLLMVVGGALGGLLWRR